jgi:hypothetical protein
MEKKLVTKSLSEFGIDSGLQQGRFNGIGAETGDAFNDFWWKQTCHFESHLNKQFPHSSIFVSDHVPDYKSFGIWPERESPVDDIYTTSLRYLEVEQPQASVVFASPLGYPLGAGRIVTNLSGIWMDLDLVWWFIAKCQRSTFELFSLSNVKRKLEGVGLSNSLVWVGDLASTSVEPKKYWEQIYSNEGLLPIGKTERQKEKGFDLGYELIRRISQRCCVHDEDELSNVYISRSIASHRIIKVECNKRIFDRDFVEGIARLVAGFDETWALRFSVYEDFIVDDGYLGGLLILPGGKYVSEGE